jgi:hypothetical protein
MADILTKYWLEFVTLAIAVSGGVPGLITLVDWIRNKPKFHFTLVHMFYAEDSDESDPTMLLVLIGSAANRGNVPLVPGCFDLEAIVDGRLITFHRLLLTGDIIRAKMAETGHPVQIRLEGGESRNLNAYEGAIPSNAAIHGHLAFTTQEIRCKDFSTREELELVVICRDVFNKKHKCYVELDLSDSKADVIHPQQGYSLHSAEDSLPTSERGPAAAGKSPSVDEQRSTD